MNRYFLKIKSFFLNFKRIRPHMIMAFLSKKEKIVLLVLSVSLLICLGFLIRQHYRDTKLIPQYGGTLIEGVVSLNNTDLDDAIARLSKSGLMRYGENGAIVPDIASSYQIEDAGKKYTFTLKDGFDSNKLLLEIGDKKSEIWPGVTIETPQPNLFVFHLPQAYSPFLSLTTLPIFNAGPYELSKKESNVLHFKARTNYQFNKPYLNQIIVRIYPDEQGLIKALRKGEIMAAGSTDEAVKNNKVSGMDLLQFSLPRYRMMFFNMAQVADVNVRQKIKNNEPVTYPTPLSLVTNEDPVNMQLADQEKARLEKIGLQINLTIVSDLELKKEILPAKNYHLLIYGIDYGVDPDPYPFWHSSQIETGSNLSNYYNNQVNKLLEQARLETDSAKRQGIYQQFQEIFDKEVPAIVLNQDIFYYQVSKKVSGMRIYQNNKLPTDRFYAINEWYIKNRRVKK